MEFDAGVYRDESVIRNNDDGDVVKVKKDHDIRSKTKKVVDHSNLRTVTSLTLSNNILEKLREEKENGQFLDMSLKINFSSLGVDTIAVHKCVMAAVSPYISALFRNNSKQSEIDLTFVNAESVTCLVKWSYSGVLEIKETYCQDLLVISDFLCIDDTFKECVDYYCDHLNPENCCEIYYIASSFQTFNFAGRVRKYLLTNFSNLIQNNSLKMLSKEDFFSLVTDDDLIVVSDKGFPLEPSEEEAEMFHLMCSYLKDNNAYNLWPEILENVLRMGFLSPVKLKEIIKKSHVSMGRVSWLGDCRDKKNCLDLLKSVRNCKQPDLLAARNPLWTRPRKGIEKNLSYDWTDMYAANESYTFLSIPDNGDFNDVRSILDELKSNGLPLIVYVKGIKLHTWSWENTTVIGGIEVTYNNGKTICHGGNRNSGKIWEFKLHPGEKIAHIKLRSGWLIDGIQFITSSGRISPYYGGQGGAERQINTPRPGAYLAGIKGQVVYSQGSNVVRKLNFAWSYINNKQSQ